MFSDNVSYFTESIEIFCYCGSDDLRAPSVLGNVFYLNRCCLLECNVILLSYIAVRLASVSVFLFSSGKDVQILTLENASETKCPMTLSAMTKTIMSYTTGIRT